MKKGEIIIVVGALLVLLAVVLASCGQTPPSPTLTPSLPPPEPTNTPSPEPTATVTATAEPVPGDAAYAVDLIEAWVSAGAPKTEPFEYKGIDGNTYKATFEADILPLFTQDNVWFEGSMACTSCHFAPSENSYHELGLGSYENIMTGVDSVSSPPGKSILGESSPGAKDFDWKNSILRARLRNNRMPPGSPFDITEANRDGPCLEVSAEGVKVQLGKFDCENHAVDLIGAWVEAGAPNGEFEFAGVKLTFERDVLPFFTQPNMWFEGSQACVTCHFAPSENSYHELGLGSYEDIMKGVDSISSPPGKSILGESSPGAKDFDWKNSILRARLRNNRMPPGSPFDITEANRNGPLVLHGKRVEEKKTTAMFGNGECQVKAVNLIGAWVEAGAPNGSFDFTAEDGSACTGDFTTDILPLFTQSGVWFEGSQACVSCHFAPSENSYHELGLGSYENIMTGVDSVSSPPGKSILGESSPGAKDFDWKNSILRARLRNNRMPPGSPFDITEANRDGPCLEVSAEGVKVQLGKFDCENHAVDLIGAWVEAGAPNGEFEFAGVTLTFERDVLPFFTQPNMWFEGSQACVTCHFAPSENSYHELGLGSYEDIMKGVDSISSPPGKSILGESSPGAKDFDWKNSILRARLRNNRMPPGSPFDITEVNRDGPIVLAGKKK